jgi:hypothetical protein
MVTGGLDMKSYKKAYQKGNVCAEGPEPVYTECAHILPFSLALTGDGDAEVRIAFLEFGWSSYV